jgi:hypothetical protein
MPSNNLLIQTKGGGFSKGLKGQLSFLASAHLTITHCRAEELSDEESRSENVQWRFFA